MLELARKWAPLALFVAVVAIVVVYLSTHSVTEIAASVVKHGPGMVSSAVTAGVIVILGVVCVQCRTREFRKVDEIKKFEQALWARYGLPMPTPFVVQDSDGVTDDSKRGQADRLIAHIDRIIDRQINKARGILPFNSILLALLGFGKGHFAEFTFPLLVLTFLGLLASSFICLLRMFMIEYQGNETYKSFLREFDNAVKLARRRATEIEWATTLSACSLLSAAIAVVISGMWSIAPPPTH